MVIKGYIKSTDSVTITCCESVSDVEIGGVSLYSILDKRFGLDPEDGWNLPSDTDPNDEEDKLLGVSYLILDKDPDNEDHETVIGEWIIKKLYTEYIGGCYSEYTCGYGGYDFFIDGGHNIFKEMLSHEGKYVILNINDIREVSIDMILNS